MLKRFPQLWGARLGNASKPLTLPAKEKRKGIALDVMGTSDRGPQGSLMGPQALTNFFSESFGLDFERILYIKISQ